jgi:hypothetical protein
MKLLYAPDTADHPNWGCRFMGDWYRQALVDLDGVRLRRLGSRWFFRDDPHVPAPRTWAELLVVAHAVREGRSQGLSAVLPMLAACDLLFINGENFIRPGTLKGRRLLMLGLSGEGGVRQGRGADQPHPRPVGTRAGRTGGECAAAAR